MAIWSQDPHAALTHLDAEPPAAHQLRRQIAELWDIFFTGFRADEVAFEAVKYQEAAEAVAAEFAALEDTEVPSLDLSRRMIDLLAAFLG